MKELDDGKYAYSWYEKAPDVAGDAEEASSTAMRAASA